MKLSSVFLLWVLLVPCRAQTNGPVHVAKATQLMGEHLYAEAGAEFEQALAEQPGDAQIRFQYGACLFAQGRNDEARQQFERVRQQAGMSPGLQYYLGRLDLLDGKVERAIEELRTVASNPAFRRGTFYLGLAWMAAGNLHEGTRCLENAEAASPHDAQVHYRLARAYSLEGRAQESGREYRLYRESNEAVKTTETYVRACAEALRTQATAAARPVCEKIRDPNDPEQLILLGQLYGEAGAYADAIAPLQRAAELDQESFEAWHDLGLSLFRLKRYADARKPLERAVALNPNFFETLNLLAATLYVLGEDDAALPVLERAHQLRPGDAQIAATLEQLRATRRSKQ